MDFLEKATSGTANVVVVGAGYVGLPLAVEIGRVGFPVTALDKREDRVTTLLEGRSYIKDVPDEAVAELVKKGVFTATVEPEVLGEADAIVICVPTPLRKTKDPDVSFIMDAAEHVATHLRPQQLVVLESTTYPGFTREMLLPKLESSGLRVGEDFYLAFSPERVDPGNEKYQTKNTPKVIGGITEPCLERVRALYSSFIDNLVPVSSTDGAEMVKLLENTFRAVNIALVNEVALMCHRLGLDTWEVIDAAASKPFGFMAFYPGPGLGGHCIPIDPHYLSWKLKTLEYRARFIELAGEVNTSMPQVVCERVVEALNDDCRSVKESKILVLGVAYKRHIDDVRESPALDIIDILQKKGGVLSYHDPYVASFEVGRGVMGSVELDDLGAYDCVVVITDHSEIDYRRVCSEARLVVDTRNATAPYRREAKARIVTL
jgi:UDP-N-acetyl-D-glucosamine dehydrogenase